MTIIDSHTHIGASTSVDDLLHSMDQAKIDKALVFGSAIFNMPNSTLLSALEPHQDRLSAVGYVDVNAQFPFDLHIEDILDRVVAAKFYTGYEYFYPTNAKVMAICEVLSKAGKPSIFHMGDCANSCKHARVRYARPDRIDDLAVSFPDLKIVIAHIGWPWHREAAYAAYKHPNVYCDVSGFVYGDWKTQDQTQIRTVLHEFLDIAPINKLLFGTDFPISNQKSYVETFEGMIVSGTPFSIQRMSEITKQVFNLKGAST